MAFIFCVVPSEIKKLLVTLAKIEGSSLSDEIRNAIATHLEREADEIQLREEESASWAPLVAKLEEFNAS